MFNTETSSGRRRLFLLVLLVFLVAGFTAKHLLIRLGWVGGGRSEAEHPRMVEAPVSQPAGSEEGTGKQSPDLKEAEAFAARYLVMYASRDPAKKAERLNGLRPHTTAEFFAILEEEANGARPTAENEVTTVSDITRGSCEEDREAVTCILQCSLVERGRDGKEILTEQVYELRLIRDGSGWKTEGVSVRGSFE
ncbi:hypothetical protein [Staphylospora marina]|uniref:hypothetical protein n=1 Tax=Staphylospora marina TaxID=2490858 RepID=UPI000F5BD2A7|nr:hypothetical protein [Staphylospora marina]